MASIKRIYHADHGIPHMVVLQVINSLNLQPGFFLRTTTLPEGAPDALNALYGPASGDAPVDERAVIYRQRTPDRPMSRMIDLPGRPTRTVTVIGMVEDDGVIVFTCYGGPAAEREPGDPSLKTPEEKQAAIDFWSQHALAAR